ncbi:helix-turn-helix domain-containing protein [Paenibacillus eucommiae]|uniref:Two-component system response regulator YesN n=1 Tax=Paenibacillus eucommiae TaxID=1355755 RepID=A0ABS4IWN1_9BACL|nr:helix-turn-helix domain-containing protein [Paenibacillus eucommiae]MBP1991984.1 two-component system response regulator YesN [Paenibacillus eucommiae]
MRVLVVDDQRLSRAGIIKMIAWDRLDLQLAGECANGHEALEMIGDLEVDIVITDVRMPILGGLELIEHAKELYPHMAFLVISGFDDYTYVRKSIHLSVADYLLKPVDQLELNDILEKLIAKTEHGRRKAAAQLKKTREQFFYLLLEGAYDQNEQLLMDWEDIRLSEHEDHFIVAMFDSDDDRNKVHEYFHHLENRCEVILIRTRAHYYTFIAAGSADVMENVWSELRAKLRDRDLFQLAGIGTLVSGIENVKESAAKAYDAYTLQASLPMAPDNELDVLVPKALEPTQVSSLSLNSAWEREWFILIKQGNRAAILNKLEELHNITTEPLLNTELMESVYPYVLLRGARAIYEAGSLTEMTYMEAFQIAKKLPYIVELEAKRNVVADFFIRHLHAEPQIPAQKAKEAVEKAKSFIDANFNQTINLTDLAQAYYMNPGYFSTLFRQYTGRNFLEYLTQLRMEHAKSLISSNPAGKISDVAVLCGYQDLKHFRKLFKRYSGVTPLQYKEDTKID